MLVSGVDVVVGGAKSGLLVFVVLVSGVDVVVGGAKSNTIDNHTMYILKQFKIMHRKTFSCICVYTLGKKFYIRNDLSKIPI